MAYSAIDVLFRHNLIDLHLFDRLLADFSRRGNDISNVAQEWGIVLKRAEQQITPSPPEAEALKTVTKLPADEVETNRRHLSQRHAALLVERARELEDGGDETSLQDVLGESKKRIARCVPVLRSKWVPFSVTATN
ncbi:hypothetical protein OV079_06760 [Nannocystis pusilla]|uniref:Uncharacterized protein n=1 Tax=Nannocystis pusilla TaxID=889268 RepID=A0A9X3IUL1_9BACT|nr:hypothetical protein [Nannocystis pusilla]MCY1005277.1 hypothetical protein [Nannocystis pusilla]